MIIAVSDIHLGTESSNRSDFISFLNSCDKGGIDHLVLLGDIMDFWRRNNAGVVAEKKNGEILDKIARLNAGEVHYIIGNHDYSLLKFYERYGAAYPFTITKSLRLEENGQSYYFIHGYELEVLDALEPASVELYETFSENMCYAGDVVGSVAGAVWCIKEGCEKILERTTKFLKKPPCERKNIGNLYNLAISPGAYIFLGMNPDEYLVYGHTHRPYTSKTNKRANTGAWVRDNSLPDSCINTYVKIADKEVSLRKFDPGNFP